VTILNGRSAHCLGSPWAWPPVRAAQHAAGNLDNRHVAIVCAASTRVNVSAFLPTVDSANCPWPTWRRSAAGLFAVGQRVARSFPERWPADLLRGHEDYGSRPSTRAQGGAAWSLPLLIGGRKWTPSRATSLCSPSCRCPAQSPPGRGIETFLARCFLPSVQSLCSARPMGSGADIRYAEESPALLVGERGRGKDACGRI